AAVHLSARDDQPHAVARFAVCRYRPGRRRRPGRDLKRTMTFEERLAAIRAGMIEHGLDLVVAVHDGAHFIETPNPVFVLSRFKSLGPTAVVLPRDSEATLIVTPAWDSERPAERCPAL